MSDTREVTEEKILAILTHYFGTSLGPGSGQVLKGAAKAVVEGLDVLGAEQEGFVPDGKPSRGGSFVYDQDAEGRPTVAIEVTTNGIGGTHA